MRAGSQGTWLPEAMAETLGASWRSIASLSSASHNLWSVNR